jgi:superfamily II DNA or RNA helicase
MTSPCILRSKLPLNPHQKKVVDFLERDKVRGLLVVHGVGTGKTLTGVTVSQCFLDKYPESEVFVVTPTSLQENFKKELAAYHGKKEHKDKRYRFYTIQGFTHAFKKGKLGPKDCEDALLIIDEAHNIRTEVKDDTKGGDDKCTNKTLTGINARSLIEASKHARKVLLLSATPLINRPCELINLMSIVDGVNPISVEKFNKISHEEYFKCKVSFYETSSTQRKANYPSVVDKDVFITMTPSYYKRYIRIEQHGEPNERAFYNGVRKGSNSLEIENSPKINWVMEHLSKSKDEDKYVIFSHFIGSGLSLLMKRMDSKGISYVHVTGDISMKNRQKAVSDYNSGKVKVMLISKAGGEGLDLKNTRNVILLEPSWNESTHHQVIGRAVRYQSHASLPKAEQTVNVFRLFHIKPSEESFVKKAVEELWTKDEETGDYLSVDLFLRNFSQKKQQKIDEFIDILKDVSIERNNCEETTPFRVPTSPKRKSPKKKSVRKSKSPKKSQKKSPKKSKSKSPKKSARKPKSPKSKTSARKPKRKSPKPCKEGKIRNEKGRCVNDPSLKPKKPKKSARKSRKSPKPCKDGKIRNEKGRCVNDPSLKPNKPKKSARKSRKSPKPKKSAPKPKSPKPKKSAPKPKSPKPKSTKTSDDVEQPWKCVKPYSKQYGTTAERIKSCSENGSAMKGYEKRGGSSRQTCIENCHF